MNAYAMAGSILGFVMFFPMYMQVRKGKQQNLASWLLWCAIALISACSIASRRGNFALPAAYVFGDYLIWGSILKTRNFKWTWLETLASALVAACLAIWLALGARAAIIMATIAHVTAGIPQLADACRKPQNVSALNYFGFAAASALSTIGGADWSIEQRLYPASTGLYCLSVALAASRKCLPQ